MSGADGHPGALAEGHREFAETGMQPSPPRVTVPQAGPGREDWEVTVARSPSLPALRMFHEIGFDKTMALGWPDAMSLADLSPLEGARDRIVARLRESGRVCVIGAPGTGHATLARELQLQLGAHMVLLPQVGPDSALHGLVQVAACLEDEQTRRVATLDSESVRKRAQELAHHAADSGKHLIVVVPGTWTRTPGPAGSEEMDYQVRNGEFLSGLLSVPSLRIVLLSEQLSPELRAALGDPIRLQVLPTQWEALGQEDVWGQLSEYAKKVQGFAGTGVPVPPIAARLAVGFLALRGRLEDLNRHVLGHGGDLVPVLAGAVVQLLKNNQDYEHLRDAATLLAGSRFPLPIGKVAEMTADLEEVEDLILRHCLAYGDVEVRMPEATRTAVRQRLGHPAPQASWKLSELHRSLDGAPTPSKASTTGALHWMERSHHLGQAGMEHEDAWEALVAAAGWPRELVWDHARSLSRDHRQYDKAARLFRRCRQRDEHDSYAWHYEAWNREQANKAASLPRSESAWNDVDRCYQEATGLNPTHAWCHSRYVSFLIEDVRFEEARRAWESALLNLRRGEPLSLAFNLHRWVVLAWLQRGRAQEAMEAYRSLDEEVWRQDPMLRQVRQLVLDACEADELGAEVYPAAFPFDQRWCHPGSLPKALDAAPLETWYPAHVVGSDGRLVTIVFSPVAPVHRRAMRRSIDANEWELAAGEPASEAHGFYFIGLYPGGQMRIVAMDSDMKEPELEWPRRPFADLLAAAGKGATVAG